MQINILQKECWSRLELTIFEYHLCQTLLWMLEMDQGEKNKVPVFVETEIETDH